MSDPDEEFVKALMRERESLTKKLSAVRVLLEAYSGKDDGFDSDINEEPSDEDEADPLWLTKKYDEIKNHVLSLDKSKNHSSVEHIKHKFKLSGYRHAFFYEKLKKDALIVAINRGSFRVNFIEPPEMSSDNMIHENIYDYVLTLNRNVEFLKKDVWLKFGCAYSTFQKAVSMLMEHGIVENGSSNRYLRFIHDGEIPVEKNKDEYFEIDEAKEAEYKKKVLPYIKKQDRPMPDYLKP